MPRALFQPFPMLPGRRAQAWRHQPAYQRPRHFHEEPEFNLITRGTATFGIGDARVTAQRGDLLVFHPGQDHVLLSASEDLGLYAVALQPALAERACASLAHVRSHGCRLSELETERTAELLAAAGSSAESEVPLADLFGAVRARALATHVLSRRVLEHVRADRETRGAALGDALGADPSAFSRHFHEDLGLRFVEYRARLRLIAFVRLVDSGVSMSRAALDAGFGSYAQCHRVFSASLGCSPRHYFKGERQVLDAARIGRRTLKVDFSEKVAPELPHIMGSTLPLDSMRRGCSRANTPRSSLHTQITGLTRNTQSTPEETRRTAATRLDTGLSSRIIQPVE